MGNVYFAYMGKRNPLTDWAHFFLGERYPWQNQACQIWWRLLKGFRGSGGSNFSISHWLCWFFLQHSHTTVWACDGECTTEFRTRLNRGQAIAASLQKIWKSHTIPISTKIRLMKALVWPVATFGCESWTLRKNEETRLDAFEMKGLRSMLRVSWTAKKTNEWVL